jgi:hypothetical protein
MSGGALERLEGGAPDRASAEQDALDHGGAASLPTSRRFAGLTADGILTLQRAVGNRAVSDLLAGGRDGRRLQRQGKQVSVTKVTLNHNQVTVPPEAGLSVTAKAAPANATGVQFAVEKVTVEVKDVSVDPSTGAVTIGAGQPGGDLKISAKAADGSSAWAGLRIIEKPASLTSTSASAKGGAVYGGEFVHTFAGPATGASGLKNARINEKFDATSVKTPFGPFDLSANKAGTRGWGLDDTGTMNGVDNVTIAKAGLDVRPFVKSASNPAPKLTLPQSFTMVQHMHAQSLPSWTFDAKPFVDIDHVRGIEERTGVVKVVVKAGKKEIEQDYEGPPAYRNAKATPAKAAASAPKPKAEKGKKPPAWTRNEVQVSAEAIPGSARVVFAIVETGKARLGCDIDRSSGVVKVGDQPGTISVRVSDGSNAHYDEVKIDIVAPSAPSAPSSPGSGKTAEGLVEQEMELAGIEGAPGPPEPVGDLEGTAGNLARSALARQPAVGEQLDVVRLVKAHYYDRAVAALSWYTDDQALQALALLSPEEREQLGRAASADRDKALAERIARLLKEAEARRIAKLHADWDAAIHAGRWEEAVELLNAFSPDDIDRKLADPTLTPDKLKSLEVAALKRPSGVQQRVIEKIRARSGTKAGAAFGTLKVDEYREQHGTPRTRWAMNVRLTFTPDAAIANATKIGFLQTVRMIDIATGQPDDPIPGHKARATPGGTTIDRPGGSKSGAYAQLNEGKMDAGNVLGSSPSPLVPATFKDVPNHDKAGVRWDYETAVVALEGPDAGLVYATMTWGFEVTQQALGVKEVQPRAWAVDDKPSQEFGGAVAGWNRQATGPEGERTTPGQTPLPALR